MRLASTTEREKILATIRDRLAARGEILFAYLHGSFPAGGPYRDLDLAVFLDPGQAAPRRWRRYEEALSVELQLALGQPVDVRALNDAPLAFRYHATAGLPLVVRDPERLAEFRARTWDDYFDFQPFARRYLREVLGG
jgi:predicted nucleotidyltransferase